MVAAERKLKLTEMVQKEGRPHRFKRWVYLYNRHKSKVVIGLLCLTVLLSGLLIYVGWLLYKKEPGLLIKANQMTIFQQVDEEQETSPGYYIMIDEAGGAVFESAHD